VAELAQQLESEEGSIQALVAAAMAHLNLVMIHPFRDGNGRMARCMQTLVLTRRGILVPQFSSIEEYLGRHTDEYYQVLSDVGRGRWRPDGDARPWVRFVLNAHYVQLRDHLRRIGESEELWGVMEGLARREGLSERTVPALFEGAVGRRLTNAKYRAVMDEEVSEVVAGRDLRNLVQKRLLESHGEKRGRYYVGSEELKGLREQARQPQPEEPSLFENADLESAAR
jgi:Fic family protein